MYRLIYIISIVTLCPFCGCHHKEYSVIKSGIVKNETFNYLPDFYKTDSDVFILATKLDSAESIFYEDTADRIEVYKNWFTDIDSFIKTRLKSRNLEAEVCFNFITDSICNDILVKGNNCTACLAELCWLRYGMDLYNMFEVDKDKNKFENDAWLRFWDNLLHLLEYEIGNATGTSGAYETPIVFSKIAQHRVDYCVDKKKFEANTNTALEISVKRMNNLINEISTTHWDWESEKYLDDTKYYNYKKDALTSLNEWININASKKNNIKSDTIQLIAFIDSLSNTIYHIRH